MATLASIPVLKRKSGPQLPVSWYVDPAIYALEEKALFPVVPKFWMREQLEAHL